MDRLTKLLEEAGEELVGAGIARAVKTADGRAYVALKDDLTRIIYIAAEDVEGQCSWSADLIDLQRLHALRGTGREDEARVDGFGIFMKGPYDPHLVSGMIEASYKMFSTLFEEGN